MASETLELLDVPSIDEWPDFAVAHRLTDGLPVYPPTPAAVGRMIDHLGRDPGDELGEVPPRGGVATIANVAANCVMAGCLPEYVPVVLAAVEAMLDPHFNLQGVQTTTHPCEPLAIVSGPVVSQLGFGTAECSFGGGGARANATIGRAIRLVLWNIGGGFPSEPSRKIFSHPGRYSFLLAEDAADTPWQGLHVDRGLDPGVSAVTMFACEAPHSVLSTIGTDLTPELILDRIADHMAALGSNNSTTQGEQLVVMTSFIARHLADAGWTKARVREYLYEHAQRPLVEVRPPSAQRPDTSERWWWDWLPESVDQGRDDALVPTAWSPDHIHLVVSGAVGGRFQAVCPSWGHFGGFAVTRAITRPEDERT